MKQRTVLKCVGVVIAVLACTGLFYFLSLFGRTSSRVTYLNWDSITLTVNGQLQDAPELSDPTIPLSPLEEGDFYRLTATLGATDNEQLLLDVTGAELVLRLDGVELYRSTASEPEEVTTGLATVYIPLPDGAAGRTLELDCRPLSADIGLSRPLLRLLNPTLSSQSDMAYANYYGIPAGILGMSFLLICFLFAVRLLMGSPDWTLPVLALAIATCVIRMLAQGFGAIFLPEAVCIVLASNLFMLVSPALFIICSSTGARFSGSGWACYHYFQPRLFFWHGLCLFCMTGISPTIYQTCSLRYFFTERTHGRCTGLPCSCLQHAR